MTCRVASTPVMPGMFRSITTTSGRELAHHADGLGSVGGLADDLDGLLLEQVAQPGPKQVMVVDQQDAKGALPAELVPVRASRSRRE